MKRTLRLLILWVVPGIIGHCLARADDLPYPFKIVPKPKKIKRLSGEGLRPGELTSIFCEEGIPRPVLGPELSRLPEAPRAQNGSLILSLREGTTLPESREGYVLTISGGKVRILSRGYPGLFYGCQTLEQMLEDARDSGTPLPACQIIDTPSLAYRAIHVDVKHHLDTMKYYYDLVDRIARYKLNAVVFEFEDKLRYRRQPLVGASHAISIEEMAALTRYARERHVEITPLVQGLGHASFILKHEAYMSLREDPESRWAFCPMAEGTYRVLFDLYRDACDATPGSRYLHVGGDEVGEIGQCERCRDAARKEGKLALYLHWLNRVCEFVRSQGRIPIFWDDMLLKYAGVWETVWEEMEEERVLKLWENGERLLEGLIQEFPEQGIFMRWNYTLARQPGNIRALTWYRKHGREAMVATAAQNTYPLLPQPDRVNNIQSFLRVAETEAIPGMLCTAWDDSSPHIETYWRGFVAAAEYSWNPSGRDLKAFESAYMQREFGPECSSEAGVYAELFRGVSFWNKALCVEGDRVRPGGILECPDRRNPGAWSARHADRLARAVQEMERHERLESRFARLLRLARRNRYTLELFAAINDLQVIPARLLVALRRCDVPDPEAQEAGAEDVREALEAFERA
ncbi:MAG: DUF4838 domain-containing protein, partial [Candidatus Aminicenantales bacterium]